jgi:hypothetical protein
MSSGGALSSLSQDTFFLKDTHFQGTNLMAVLGQQEEKGQR